MASVSVLRCFCPVFDEANFAQIARHADHAHSARGRRIRQRRVHHRFAGARPPATARAPLGTRLLRRVWRDKRSGAEAAVEAASARDRFTRLHSAASGRRGQDALQVERRVGGRPGGLRPVRRLAECVRGRPPPSEVDRQRPLPAARQEALVDTDRRGEARPAAHRVRARARRVPRQPRRPFADGRAQSREPERHGAGPRRVC